MKVLLLTMVTLGAAVAAGAPYAPPRTPWGDPDLQGNYTNKYEANTPLERPDEFKGRRLEDISEAELAALRAKRLKQFLERPAAVGPYQFRDPLEVTRGSRAWFLVDPPDGRIPPRTAAAQRRVENYDASFEASLDTTLGGIFNSRQRTGGSFGEGPFDTIEDFGLWDRCITRGIPGSMLPAHPRQFLSDRAGARDGRHPLRAGARHAADSARRPASRPPRHPARDGRCPGALGEQRARRRDDALQGPERRTGTRTPRRCVSSSASRARPPTGSSGRSRSTIPRRGRSRGRSPCR